MAALVSGQATADLRGRARSRRTLVHLAAFAAILGLSVWSWTATTMDLARLGRGLPRLADFFLRMIPPEISVADIIFVSAVETIQIALLGTVISAVTLAAFAMRIHSNSSGSPRAGVGPWRHTARSAVSV